MDLKKVNKQLYEQLSYWLAVSITNPTVIILICSFWYYNYSKKIKILPKHCSSI